MNGRPQWRLLLFAALFLAACGVPIAAEDSATPGAFSQASDSRLAGGPALAAIPVSPTGAPATLASTLAPEPSLTAAPASSALTGLATAEPAAPSPTATAIVTVAPAITSTPPSAAEFALEAFNLVNQYRAESGRPPLHLDARLNAAAASYARLIAETSWFTCGCDPHSGPDRSEPETRLAAAGYVGRFRGEALNGGQTSPEESVRTWLNSSRHAAILLDAAAVDIGIGYYYKPGDLYGHYWVLDTGIP